MFRTLAASILLLASSSAFAACSVDIEGNDAMQFNLASIDVAKTCKDFTVNLKHAGNLDKAIMGHNWVLAKTADLQAVATDGMAAGPDHDYVKTDDARVVAHTKVVGGGETTSVTFAVSKLDAASEYSFFCSFPGHWAIMKGTLKLI